MTVEARISTRPEPNRTEEKVAASSLRDRNINAPAHKETGNASNVDPSVSCSSAADSGQAGYNFSANFVTTPDMTNMPSFP